MNIQDKIAYNKGYQDALYKRTNVNLTNNKELRICPHCGKCSMNYDDDGSYLNWGCKTFP